MTTLTRLCHQCNRQHGELYYSEWLGSILCSACIFHHIGLAGQYLQEFLSNPARNVAGWHLVQARALPLEIRPKQEPAIFVRYGRKQHQPAQLALFEK